MGAKEASATANRSTEQDPAGEVDCSTEAPNAVTEKVVAEQAVAKKATEEKAAAEEAAAEKAMSEDAAAEKAAAEKAMAAADQAAAEKAMSEKAAAENAAAEKAVTETASKAIVELHGGFAEALVLAQVYLAHRLVHATAACPPNRKLSFPVHPRRR